MPSVPCIAFPFLSLCSGCFGRSHAVPHKIATDRDFLFSSPLHGCYDVSGRNCSGSRPTTTIFPLPHTGQSEISTPVTRSMVLVFILNGFDFSDYFGSVC